MGCVFDRAEHCAVLEERICSAKRCPFARTREELSRGRRAAWLRATARGYYAGYLAAVKEADGNELSDTEKGAGSAG